MTLDITRRAWHCPGGGGQYNHPIIEEAPLLLRSNTDGEVSNTRTLMDAAGNIPGGIVAIDKCPGFLVMLDITWQTLTDLDFDFEFGYYVGSSFVGFKQLIGTAEANGVVTIEPASYHLDDTGSDDRYCWWVPNPGAPYMRSYVKSTGVITNSVLYVDIFRTYYVPSDNAQSVI